jgi:hypothetical protein
MVMVSNPESGHDYQSYAVWFDPKLKGRLVFPYWRMHYEWLLSIHRAPISRIDRLRCYRSLWFWIRRRHRLLLREAWTTIFRHRKK